MSSEPRNAPPSGAASSSASGSDGAVVEFRHVVKAFRGCLANADVSLRVRAGTIHGVIGENGAGKSTAMKLLYGLYSHDSGEILVDGVSRRWRSPKDALAAGIGMVHQHFMLAGPYTALDNILIGAEPLAGGVAGLLPRMLRPLDRARARAKLERLAAQYGLPVDWDAEVERHPVGIQQRIEILKLLYRDTRILILDEPTAVLTPQETHDLFVNLKKLKSEGKTIIIITHKLKEVMSFTDHVTVMRAGRVTGEVETARSSPQELADLMVGRKVVLQVTVPPQPELGAPVLETRDLVLEGLEGSARRRLDSLSLSVRAGEVVGIAGVEGNGQTELIHAILHPTEPEYRSSGEVRVLGRDVTAAGTQDIKDLGVGVIPEDRHHEGLLLERSLAENFILGLQRSAGFSDRGVLRQAEITRAASRAVEAYDVRPRALDAQSGDLSGGNQQKLIIAREFEREPKLLIAAQPTRGVDVGAIEFIHTRILKARTEGAGVLLISSELDEIIALSDRILVLYEGRIAGEFRRGQCSEKELGLLMGGGGATSGQAASGQAVSSHAAEAKP